MSRFKNTDNHDKKKYIDELIIIIQHIKIYLSDDSDMSWTGYRSAEKLRNKLDDFMVKLQKGSLKVLDKIKFEFLPTSSFCEHALSNGWSDDYNKLADRFDVIYNTLMNNE